MSNSMPSKDSYVSERVLPLLFTMMSRDLIDKYKGKIEQNLEKNQ